MGLVASDPTPQQYDIFLSYAREDFARVSQLAQALERHGWSVWWDYDIPTGQTFAGVIAEALESSRCMIVVWSKASVESYWVKDVEAEQGRKRGILLPVMIDEVDIPLAFGPLQTANLIDWQDTAHHPEFDKLVQTIAARLGQTLDRPKPLGPIVSPEPPTGIWQWYIRRKKKLIISGFMLVICAMLIVLYVPDIINYFRHSAETRKDPLLVPESPRLFYNRSYAVVIGIDKYSDSRRWPVLRSAVADARAMASVLEERGFKVTALYGDRATKQAILQAQDDLVPQVTQEDRVLVFFAGYGHSTEPVHGAVMESLIPYDGTEDSGSYISIGELRNLALMLGKAKHQLFFLHTRFDSLPYTPGGRADASGSLDVEDVAQRIARQILVSGVLPSPASDSATPRSTFMAAVLEALQGEQADANNDCHVVVPELVNYLLAKGFQTLTLSTLPYHNGGEFAFRMARTLTPEQVEARLRDKTLSLCGLNLQNLDLQGRDLSGRNLREADLSHADLRQAILQGADLRRAKLAKANLRGAMLQEAWLSRADLEEADLVEIDLRRANLHKAYLHKVNLQRAQLQGAVLSEARLTEADLIEADLFGADLDLADLSNAWLKDTKLNKAKLGRAILRGALLRGTALSEADLRDADVEDMQYEPSKASWPKLEFMQQAKHLDKMTCAISPRALGELRNQFQHLGMHEAAQQVTSAIMRCEARLKTLRQ